MLFLNKNLSIKKSFTSSEGPWLIDSSGKKFFDCWLGAGTLIFGHTLELENKFQGNFINRMLPENGIRLELLNLIKDLVDFEVGSIGIQTSGSSAITRACRVARAYKNRRKIALFADFWHGSEDEFLFRREYEELSEGLAFNPSDRYVWFSNVDDFLNKADLKEFAAILIEPFQGSNPEINMVQTLADPSKREILKNNDVLLIHDEIITGFRTEYGSASNSRICNPDIVVFGKACSGGYPTGLVILSQNLTLKIKNKNIFWGGTFAGNPTQLYYLELQLIKLKKLDYSLIKRNLGSICNYFEQQIQLENFNHQLSIGEGFARILPKNNIQPTSRGFLNQKNDSQIELEKKCKELNLYIPSNRLLFPSIFNIHLIK